MPSSNEILVSVGFTLVAVYASVFVAYQSWSFRVRRFFEDIGSFLGDAGRTLKHIDSYIERRADERERMLELLRQRNAQYARPQHAPGSWQESVSNAVKSWANVEDRKGGLDRFLSGVAATIFNAMLKERGPESCFIHFKCQYAAFIRDLNSKYWGRLNYSYAGRTHVVTGYLQGVEAKAEFQIILVGNSLAVVPKNLPTIPDPTPTGKNIRERIQDYLNSPVPIHSLKVPQDVQAQEWPYKGKVADYVTASTHRYLYDDVVKACSQIRPANSFEYLIAIRFMLESIPKYAKLRSGLRLRPFASILIWGPCQGKDIRLHLAVENGERILSVQVLNQEARELIESDGAIVQ